MEEDLSALRIAWMQQFRDSKNIQKRTKTDYSSQQQQQQQQYQKN